MAIRRGHKDWPSAVRCRIAPVLAVALVLTVLTARPVQAQTFKVLHTFTGTPDGALPFDSLIRDPSGNLYGTSYLGGMGPCVSSLGSGCGTVFKLDTSGNETVFYRFTGRTDGSNPYGNLLGDKAGNLYGTTTSGAEGFGTVFKLNSAGKLTVLYTFTGGDDGFNSDAGLIRDSAGNFYGTTLDGGFDFGTVFKLDAAGTKTVLHSFTGTLSDGAYPQAPLIPNASGKFWGTTSGGGSTQNGTVFQVDEKGNETILHNFGIGGMPPCPTPP